MGVKSKFSNILILGIFTIIMFSGPMSFSGFNSAEAVLDGSQHNCPNFVIDFFLFDKDIADPAWVFVNQTQQFQEVTGVVTTSRVSHTDFPAAHYSHDTIVDIIVDPEYEFLLSDVNRDDPTDPRSPDKIEIEWENGILPSEKTGDGANPTFPKWAWPSIGDRVWADGLWIFDCGHGEKVDGVEHHRSEIHPARAIASMRDQVVPIPGSGSNPVRAVVTDLYIHGQGGFATQIVNCGADIMLANINTCPHTLNNIEEYFDFEIKLPPKPHPAAILSTSFYDGPGNTIDIDPELIPFPENDPTLVKVIIPLNGTGVDPLDVYAKKIFTGWISPPDDLRHFQLNLVKMDLHQDHEQDPGDCECTFFFLNVDRAPNNEWIRLSDFALGNMNDYDDDGYLGNGLMHFAPAPFDYYVAGGMNVTIQADGYDQDCLDDHFGDNFFKKTTFLDCYLKAFVEFNAGDNDRLSHFLASYGPPDYGVGYNDVKSVEKINTHDNRWVGEVTSKTHEYDLVYTIDEILLNSEKSVNLELLNGCSKDIGASFTCGVEVKNNGPALPKNTVISGSISTDLDPVDYTMNPATFIIENDNFIPPFLNCTMPSSTQFSCDVGSIPVGDSAIVTFDVDLARPGVFDFSASVNSANAGAGAVITVENLDYAQGLYVSASNLEFDKYFAGPQIVEVVVSDDNKFTGDTPHGEPDVTVNGKNLRMVQAVDGNWYGYFADVQQALFADSTTSAAGIGLDFGQFCGPNSGNFLSGDPGNYNVDIADTLGIAISDPTDVSNSVQGTGFPQVLNNICAKTDNDSSSNSLMNVLSDPIQINEMEPGSLEAVGQIGIDKDFWPFIQLYDFNPTGQVVISWNDGGGVDSETLTFDVVGQFVELKLDDNVFPRNAQVHVEITDPQLNIDPTSPDSWTFDTSGSSTLYRVFDEFGNPNGDGTSAALFDIQSVLGDMMFEDNGKLLINADSGPVGTNVLLIQDNGDDEILCADKQDLHSCFTSGGTLVAGTQPVTIVETGPNTGIFTTIDSSRISGLKITGDAVRASAASIDYNDSPATILVGFDDGTFEIHPIDNTWNSGEEIEITLSDDDANKNSRIADKISVIDPDMGDMPTMKTGSPFGLEYSSDVSASFIGAVSFSSFIAQGNIADNNDLAAKQDLLVYRGDLPSSWGGVVFDFGDSVTFFDLQESIGNPIDVDAGGSVFRGENLFNFDFRGLEVIDEMEFPTVYLIANNDGSPIILPNGDVSAEHSILLSKTMGFRGLQLLSSNHPDDFSQSQSLHEFMFNGTISDNARIGLGVCVGLVNESGCQVLSTDNQNLEFAAIADFFSFGFKNDGMLADERIANQIIRLELKEVGVNSGNFDGSLEFLMVNQLNVLDENTYKDITPIDDQATFIVFDSMTDEDTPRVIYPDLTSTGTISHLSVIEDAPTFTGVLQIDEFSYKVGDTVQISVIDPDLSTDSDLIDIFTAVPPTVISTEDPASETLGKAGFPELSFGPLGTLVSVEFVDDGKWASPSADIDGIPGPDCTPITGDDGLSSTGISLIETGPSSGIFQGDFTIPTVYCSRAENGIKEIFDGAQIKVSYLDFRDSTGEITVKSATAGIKAIQVKKLFALDGSDDDYFGQKTGVYGDTIVIGVPFDDDEGFDSGSAYVFSQNQGGPGNWGQVKKLFPEDGSLDQAVFGQSVAIFGDTIVVGEPVDNSVTAASGSAHIFSRHQEGVNNWGLEKKLLPTNNVDPTQFFGQRVSIWEDIIVVSATADDDGPGKGTVYVLSRDQDGDDNWGLVKKILSINGLDSNFGKNLSIHGDTLAVVSDQIDNLTVLDEVVYVFSKDQGGDDNWGLVKALHSSDQDTADFFGASTAVWGDTIVVGAPRADTSAGNTGAAYVFSKNHEGPNNWGEVKKIEASDGGIAVNKLDEFGKSVDIHGDKIIVGAPHTPNFPAGQFTGAAYLYSQNHEGENNWGEVQRLEALDFLDNLGFEFGDNVGISGGVIVVGAAKDDWDPSRGAAYVYEYGLHSDADGIPDPGDNCPLVDNINQLDLDADAIGNACDTLNVIIQDTIVSEDQMSLGELFVTPGKGITIESSTDLTVLGPVRIDSEDQIGGILITSGGSLKIIQPSLFSFANVAIPTGTSTPGCENTNSCYLPYITNIAIGGKVTWTNNDSAAHTVTSGNPAGGLDGIFDSSLIFAGNDFEVDFDGLPAGQYPYFCLIHPWQQGWVTVG